MFSPNTSKHVRDQVLTALGVEHTAKNEKYLGLPIYIGKYKQRMFEHIKQKNLGKNSGLARETPIQSREGDYD